MRANFELVARSLVDVRRAQDVEPLDLGRQRDRALDDGARALRGFDDFLRRLVDQLVIERLQADADSLVLHFELSVIQLAYLFIRAPWPRRRRRRSGRLRESQSASPLPSQSARSRSPSSGCCPQASPSRSPPAAPHSRSHPSSESKTAAGSPERTAYAARPLPCSGCTPRS